MKITTKTTKEQLKSFLGANVSAVKKQDKDLFDRIAYADKVSKKDESKVTRTDLVALVKDVIKLLGDKCVEPALAQSTPQAENSVKKLSKGAKEPKKEEVSKESAKSESKEKAEKVDTKKSAKKSLGKKEEPKKDGVTVLNETQNEKVVQLAEMFPKTLEIGDTKYELASDIKTMDDLYEALRDNDEEIVFAYYWTKRHLKQFKYFEGLLGQPKSFDNDLDLTSAIFISDEKTVCYSVSHYTNAFYTIRPQDLEEEDGVRVAYGIEYQIYRAVTK